ncbi:hypothetical protein Tco_0990960 [Tanacetum coccineum]|uniref:Reverse transcriptase RNase H-like domain-containing protein n=1 Tax=Tanacetum coccineum TaxID=301880 RepID=A0ABQ5EXX3_9ASTR
MQNDRKSFLLVLSARDYVFVRDRFAQLRGPDATNYLHLWHLGGHGHHDDLCYVGSDCLGIVLFNFLLFSAWHFEKSACSFCPYVSETFYWTLTLECLRLPTLLKGLHQSWPCPRGKKLKISSDIAIFEKGLGGCSDAERKVDFLIESRQLKIHEKNYTTHDLELGLSSGVRSQVWETLFIWELRDGVHRSQ